MKYNIDCRKGNNMKEEEIITYAFVIKSLEDKVRMTLQFSYLEFFCRIRVNNGIEICVICFYVRFLYFFFM